jgi:hypothetical protein
MPLLDFNPRSFLKELRKANSGDLATAATVATANLDKQVEDLNKSYPIEEAYSDINRMHQYDGCHVEFSRRVVATAATAATPQKILNVINWLAANPPIHEGGYSVAKAGYSVAAKVLAQLNTGIHVEDDAVINVLRDTNAEFMERAAISEIDGGLTRSEAERLALEELVIAWWEESSDRQHARAILWGDVRRLAFKELMRKVSE